jgi:hypothetical protein
VEDQHLGQEELVLAPAAIALADGDEDLDQHRPMEVVHELDEPLAPLREERRLLAYSELAAGDVQVAALAKKLAKLRRQVGEVELRHGWYYQGRDGSVAS